MLEKPAMFDFMRSKVVVRSNHKGLTYQRNKVAARAQPDKQNLVEELLRRIAPPPPIQILGGEGHRQLPSREDALAELLRGGRRQPPSMQSDRISEQSARDVNTWTSPTSDQRPSHQGMAMVGGAGGATAPRDALDEPRDTKRQENDAKKKEELAQTLVQRMEDAAGMRLAAKKGGAKEQKNASSKVPPHKSVKATSAKKRPASAAALPEPKMSKTGLPEQAVQGKTVVYKTGKIQFSAAKEAFRLFRDRANLSDSAVKWSKHGGKAKAWKHCLGEIDKYANKGR